MSISDFKVKISDKMDKDIYSIIEKSLLNTNRKKLDNEINTLALRIVNEPDLGWATQLKKFVHNNPIFIKILRDKLSKSYSDCDENMQIALINLGILFIDEIGYDWIKKFINGGVHSFAKYDLFSFLVSKNLKFAKELDDEYVKSNFGDFIRIDTNDIKVLVNAVNNDENNINVLEKLIDDTPFLRFEIIEYIISLLRSDNNFEMGQIFLERILSSKNECVVQLAFDILESKTAKKRMEEKYRYTISEYIFSSYINLNNSSSILLKNSLKGLINNTKKEKKFDEVSFAARNGIKNLSENDRKILYETAQNYSKTYVNDADLNIIRIPSNEKWDIADYSYFLQEYFEQCNREAKELAKILGFPVLVDEFETKEFEGCLIRHSSLIKPIIVANKVGKSTGRLNFTIAHEIGHGILKGHDRISEYVCNSSDICEDEFNTKINEKENEANRFAKNLLLPKKMFLKIIENLNFDYKNILKLKNKFNTSITLTAMRWVELSKDDIAIFYTIGENYKWWKGSETFFDKYNDKEPKSIIKVNNIYNAIENPSITIEDVYDSDEWFEEKTRYKFFIQSKCIYKNKVLSLIYIKEDL